MENMSELSSFAINVLEVLAFLFIFVVGALLAYIIVLYVIDLFQFNEQQLGFFLLFVGSFLIFNQLIAFPFFAKRFDLDFGQKIKIKVMIIKNWTKKAK